MTFLQLLCRIAVKNIARSVRRRARRAPRRKVDRVRSTRRATPPCSYCYGTGCVDCLSYAVHGEAGASYGLQRDDGSRKHVTGITAWRNTVQL
jgi:hypothetical protein